VRRRGARKASRLSRKSTRRWQLVSRATLAVAAVMFLALGLMLAKGDSSADAQAIVAVLGGLAAITTVASNVLVLLTAKDARPASSDLVVANLRTDAHFVDRDDEVKALARLLAEHACVSCHGSQGTGKSYLLQYFADVVNGHRRARSGHPETPEIAAAVYFDLADAAGWDQFVAQVCRMTLGDEVYSWQRFVNAMQEVFGDQQVLLILDNLNSQGLWPSIGKAAYAYLVARPDDRLVIGSIDPIAFDNLSPAQLEVVAFGTPAVQEFATARGIKMDLSAALELHQKTLGLPLFLKFILSQPGDLPGNRLAVTNMMEDVLQAEPMRPARRALGFIALLALVERRILTSELRRLPIADVEAQLQRAESRSLVAIASREGSQAIQVHDIVRDNTLRVLADDVSEAARVLFELALDKEREVEACIFGLFADPSAIGEERLEHLLRAVTLGAVSTRNYALLETIHSRIVTSERMIAFVHAEADRRDLFSYGWASALAGLGQYREAEDELLASSVIGVRPGALDNLTDLQVELYYLLADVTHLQNRYDEAAAMFRDLAALSVARGDPRRESLCLRGVAHVLRHQGRDFETALDLFEDALRAANEAGDLRARLHATTGPIGIRVYLDTASDDDMAALRDLEAELATAPNMQSYCCNIWKYRAQVAWCIGRQSEAFLHLTNAIEGALELNDRMLYNLYFDRAEYVRLCGQPDEAARDYRTVLRFGRGNGDRNLIANAQLGLAACDLTLDAWPIFGSAEGARAGVLEARALALKADIQATAEAATNLATLIDKNERFAAPRFIVF
jgi:tetratricopeptide (TPR) repeat protein/cytochrome c553